MDCATHCMCLRFVQTIHRQFVCNLLMVVVKGHMATISVLALLSVCAAVQVFTTYDGWQVILSRTRQKLFKKSKG